MIIALVLRSLSLPVLLVALIEAAIAANLCIPYFTNTTLPFVAPILISTIQLGSTVDYAILMTTKYLQNRRSGQGRKEAVGAAVASSAQSILVSGLSFFRRHLWRRPVFQRRHYFLHVQPDGLAARCAPWWWCCSCAPPCC